MYLSLPLASSSKCTLQVWGTGEKLLLECKLALHYDAASAHPLLEGVGQHSA